MSEPLTREERESLKQMVKGAPFDNYWQRALNDLEALEKEAQGMEREVRVTRAERDTLRAQLEALEKQHAADLEAQQAAMLKCIREERVSKQAQLEAAHRKIDEQRSDNAEIRARCGQLEAATAELNGEYEKRQTLELQLETASKAVVDLDAELEAHATDRVNQRAEVGALRARCEQLEQLYSHKDLDFECAERGCKSKRLEAALRDVVQASQDEWGNCTMSDCKCSNHIARAALENSTIASESTG